VRMQRSVTEWPHAPHLRCKDELRCNPKAFFDFHGRGLQRLAAFQAAFALHLILVCCRDQARSLVRFSPRRPLVRP
jgi:hypothetical protein